MDEKVEADGATYSHWNGMHFPPTHRKTAKLTKYDHEYVKLSSTANITFVYTDRGYMMDGVWEVTGVNWEKGLCIMEFERQCEGDFNLVTTKELPGLLVQDTDEVRFFCTVSIVENTTSSFY
jgi:hypothetical protein